MIFFVLNATASLLMRGAKSIVSQYDLYPDLLELDPNDGIRKIGIGWAKFAMSEGWYADIWSSALIAMHPDISYHSHK